jgi:L-lactate dehydrogenase complex protein LldF
VRSGLAFWAFFARRPRLYRLATRIAFTGLGWMGRRRGSFRSLPLAGGWTRHRDMAAPEGATFQAEWAKRRRA